MYVARGGNQTSVRVRFCYVFVYAGSDADMLTGAGSICPTFAAVALFINNARWDGVPFLLKAGKALHTRRAEIRVQFRHVPGNLYRNKMGLDVDRATNELVRLASCFMLQTAADPCMPLLLLRHGHSARLSIV